MMPITKTVTYSNSLDEATERFLDAIGAWIGRVIEAHPDGFVSDSHDGGTFMVPWSTYIQARNDGRPVEFMRRYRDNAKDHFESTGQWMHGYWREQEAHHGTEHFDLFIRALYEVSPDDGDTVEQLEDAAEHVGNWTHDIPKWFNWEAGVFRSFHLGTEKVGEPTFNVPDHMRMASLCLLAHQMTHRERYLEFARLYTGRWAEALLASQNRLPAALGDSGGVYGLGEDEDSYRSFAGAAPDDLEDEVAKAENLLASAVPDTLLGTWQKTEDQHLVRAAKRIIDVAAQCLANPIAWQAQAAIRRYRDITGSDRYDERVKKLPARALRPAETITIIIEPENRAITGTIGMRGDKPDWLDENGEPAPGPILQALYAQITDDRDLMTQAVDMALTRFNLAAEAFGDITEHGCGSRSLSAICRGHGRRSGAGMVTEVLHPALYRQWGQSP